MGFAQRAVVEVSADKKSGLYDLALQEAGFRYPNDEKSQVIYMAGFLSGCKFLSESLDEALTRLIS